MYWLVGGLAPLDGTPRAGRHGDVLRLFTDPDTADDRKRQLARALFADR